MFFSHYQWLRNTLAIWERVSKWVFKCSLCTADLCKETALIPHQPILPLHLETAASTFIHQEEHLRSALSLRIKVLLPPVGRPQNCPCNVLQSTDNHNHVAFLSREITDICDRPVELLPELQKRKFPLQEFLSPVSLHSALCS